MAEAPYWTGVSVRAPRPTLAASGHEAAVWGQLGHQSARVSRHRHDPKPLQFHRRLDQTFQEHESPLRYPGCVTTPKYLMRLMFFNSQPSSAYIHLYDEPVVQAFNGTVVDGHAEVVEDVLLVAAQHPGEVSQRWQA